MTSHMEKKYPSKLTYIPTTTKKIITFTKLQHKEAVNKYNELLKDPKVYSIYMDPEWNGGWIIEYEVYTKDWLKKYGK